MPQSSSSKQPGKGWLKGLLGLLAAMGLGYLGGTVLGQFFGSEIADLVRGEPIIYLIATVPLSFFLHIIIHEGGHLVGGLLTGYQFVSFRVMDLKFERTAPGRYQFRWQQVAGTGGQCLMRPPRYRAQHFPYRLYLAGGVLANALTSILAFWLWPSAYSLIFAVIGLLLAVSNAWPTAITDGQHLRLLGKSELNRFIFYLMLEDNYWAAQGKSFDEKYRLLRQVTINETNFLTDMVLFYDMDQLLDQWQFEEIYILAKKLYQERQDWVPAYRQALLQILFLVTSLQHPEDPLLDTLQADPLLVASLKAKRPNNAAARAAYAWRVQGDVATARAYLSQAKKYLPRAQHLRDQEQCARLIDYLEEQIQAEA